MTSPDCHLLQLADACPVCPPGDYAPVFPSADPVDDGGSLRAAYRHEACGAEWDCWWDPASLGWPLRRGKAAA